MKFKNIISILILVSCSYSLFALENSSINHKKWMSAIDQMAVNSTTGNLVVGLNNGSVKEYDFTKKSWLNLVDPSSSILIQMLISPTGRNMIIALGNDKIKLYNFKTKNIYSVPAFLSPITYMLITPDSRNLIISFDNGFGYGDIEEYNFSNNKWKKLHSPDWDSTINSMVITSDCRFLIAGLSDGSIRLYNFSLKKWVQIHDSSWKEPVNEMLLTPDNKTLFVGLGYGSVEQYNLSTGKWKELHDDSFLSGINDIYFNSKTNNLFVGLSNGELEKYNGKNKKWTLLKKWDYSILQITMIQNKYFVGLSDGSIKIILVHDIFSIHLPVLCLYSTF
jgi:WD40 repeat protein